MKQAIDRHKTLITGVAIAVLGTLQASISTIQEYIPPFAYALMNIFLGLTVAGIGAYNTIITKLRQSQESQKTDGSET